MARSRRYTTDVVERGQRLAESGKLPKSGGSRRSDEIRAIAQNMRETVDNTEFSDDDEVFWAFLEDDPYEEIL